MNMDIHQYGGIKGSSTTHALVDMIQHWHSMIHNNETVRIMFIDFSKAFDSVNHNLLIQKFKDLDIHPLIIRWMHAFLHHREQRVKIGSEVSSWLTLHGGVPQGSWLAPLCFIIYISDISIDRKLKIHKYIDDITITENITSVQQSVMQESMDIILEWASSNSMKINGRKTKEMVLSFKQNKLAVPPIACGGADIARVSTFKILGVLFSGDMTWTNHCEFMYSKASLRLYYLRQLRRCGLPDSDILMYYKSVVRPVLEYACPAWHTGLTKQNSDMLEQIQRRAMRVIYPSSSYAEACVMGHIDTLYARREFLCRQFFRNMCHEDHKLNYLLHKRDPIQYNIRHQNPYDIQIPHTERFKNSFIMYALLHYV